MSAFPQRRLRRLRSSPALRGLRRETTLSAADFVYPLFVVERREDAGPVPSMPGVVRHFSDDLEPEIEQIIEARVPSVLLFGIPAHKDAHGTSAYLDDGVVPEAIRRIKAIDENLVVVTDVCLCGYTDHGHCGVVREHRIMNDETLDLVGRTATAHARAGADLVAPSGMMDGVVGATRQSLDLNGFHDVGILSYSVKYASAFYGPFRDAVECAPKSGDRRSHQMDPANSGEALAEVELDIQEGADMIMVKPAMPYLDVIRRLKTSFPQMPLAAYQVSGEYSMIKAGVCQGWLEERQAVLESLTGIKRAGADVIITYFAKDAAARLMNDLDVQ